MSKIEEKARKYYPTFWGVEELRKLVDGGYLSAEAYENITGESYES